MRTRTVVALVLGGVAVSIACGLLPLWIFPDWQARAAFGDMFAVGEAVASALALGGVVVAIVLQRQELQLQRDELTQTREVLKLQQQDMRQSAEAQRKTEGSLRAQLALLQETANIERDRIRTLLAAASNEVLFCLGKMQDAAKMLAGVSPEGLDVAGPMFSVPAFSIHGEFLEHLRKEIASHSLARGDWVRDIGHCHFEVCFVSQRLEILRRHDSADPLFFNEVGNILELINSNASSLEAIGERLAAAGAGPIAPLPAASAEGAAEGVSRALSAGVGPPPRAT